MIDRLDRYAQLYGDVHRERIRAHEKHDAAGGSMERRPWHDGMWLPVLTEEIGEVARVLCDFELGVAGAFLDGSPADKLREELVQVAAMACAWIAALDELDP